MVKTCLVLWETTKPSPMWLHHLCHPHSDWGEFLWLQALPRPGLGTCTKLTGSFPHWGLMAPGTAFIEGMSPSARCERMLAISQSSSHLIISVPPWTCAILSPLLTRHWRLGSHTTSQRSQTAKIGSWTGDRLTLEPTRLPPGTLSLCHELYSHWKRVWDSPGPSYACWAVWA